MIKQALYLDINKGDILLGGRFKNVPTEVKKFGKDKLNQPTVNGKKLLAFRIKKLMPKKMEKRAAIFSNIKRDAFINEMEKIALNAQSVHALAKKFSLIYEGTGRKWALRQLRKGKTWDQLGL